MLRFALIAGPELSKYYTFTGATLSVKDASDLGIVTSVSEPANIDKAIDDLVSKGKPDKYKKRDIPARFKETAALCGSENALKLLTGKQPEGVSAELAAKALKTIGYKAPVALKISNEIIDSQAGKPIPEAIEIELGRLQEIFSTSDALEGLSSLGRKRPEYKGK
jgi:enoyl-CoA hydratase/3-hydroxyacyl-CoA dehydrogenase